MAQWQCWLRFPATIVITDDGAPPFSTHRQGSKK
jgi:hypothetical protein